MNNLHPVTTDVIELHGVRAWGHHGVLDHEKAAGQEFRVDVALHVETTAAARTDGLSRTVNYAEVAGSIVREISGDPVDLLETLAARIADSLLAEQILVRRLELAIHKPSAPIPHPFDDVVLRITREAPPVEAVLALGGNLGDTAAHLRRALEMLREAPGVEVDWIGPVIETDPVGGIEQSAFLNTVVGLRTCLTPWQLLDLAHRIEEDARRTRLVRWGPRTLDVDIIIYGDLRQADEDLTLPHPRAAERAFVLAPWAAARPHAVLPGAGPIAELLERAPDRGGVRPGPVVEGFPQPSARGGE